MRKLLGNSGGASTHGVTVQALDSPDNAGPCYRYEITGLDLSHNPAYRNGPIPASQTHVSLIFNDERNASCGVPNGVTVVDVLTACVTDLEAKQSRPVSDRHAPSAIRNEALALERVKAALLLLSKAAARPSRPPIQPEVPLFQYAS